MFRKGLKIYFHGWVAGSIETKAISASNLKLKLTEAELGNNSWSRHFWETNGWLVSKQENIVWLNNSCIPNFSFIGSLEVALQ